MKQIGTKYNEAWNETLIHQPTADELQVSDTESVIPVKELMMLNRQSLADDLDWHDFFSVSFTHHCEILLCMFICFLT